jgi:hypothetical protein
LTSVITRVLGRLRTAGDRVTIIAALVAGLGSLLFVIAPVVEDTVDYRWTSSPGQPSVILPLSPPRPAELTITLDCHPLVQHPGSGSNVLVNTVNAAGDGDAPTPAAGTPGTERLARDALRIRLEAGKLEINSAGTPLATLPVERLRDHSSLTVRLRPDGSVIMLDDTVISSDTRDRRPALTGVFTDPAAGPVIVRAVADSQFQSSPTVFKIIIGAGAAVALAVAFAGLARRDPARPSTGSGNEQTGRARPGPVDAAVAAIMITWTMIGSGTDDDGFIAQIARNGQAAGFYGNYVRWDNTPEAPFGWYYAVIDLLGRASWEPVWLRLLPLALGLAGWLVLRYLLLPRLIPRPSPWVITGTAAAMLLTWLVFGNSIRPEPWFALGLAVVLWLVDVARTERRALPLVAAATIAGLTTAIGPTGLVAFAPLLAGLPSLIRAFGRRTLGTRVAIILTGLAGAGIALLPMFADQTLGSTLASVAARNHYGPSFAWYDDWRRYAQVLESSFGRNLTLWPPLVLAIFVAVCWRRYGRVPGLRPRMAGLVVGSYFLFFPILMFSPTKLYHHFGGLILITPLIIAIAVQLLTRWRVPAVALAALIAALTVTGALALRQENGWWEVARLGVWSVADPIHLGRLQLATPVMIIGLLVALVIFVAGRARWTRAVPRLLTRAAVIGLALAVLFPPLAFAKALVGRPGRYTIGAASMAALTGTPCSLEHSLRAEPDPAGGVLEPDKAGTGFPGRNGDGVPVWSADGPAGLTSGWYTIPPESSEGGQVVVRVGSPGRDDRVWLETDRGAKVRLNGGGASGDLIMSLTRHGGASRVRVLAETGPESRLTLTAPRIPRTVDLAALIGDQPISVDWRIGFYAPCLHPAAVTAGRTELPAFAFGRRPIQHLTKPGSPFAGLPDVATFRWIPLYPAAPDGSFRELGYSLYRVIPMINTAGPQAHHGAAWRWGWQRTPRIAP